jgi:putative redox protein
MGTIQVSAKWTGEALDYVGTDTRGNQIKMSGQGGRDASPSQLMLIGLAGCTGMDVVSILQKKRQKIADVEVIVIGHQPDDYPKPYHKIQLHFIVKGENLDPDAVERAIQLSEEKYCVVGQTLKTNVEIKTSFKIEAASQA